MIEAVSCGGIVIYRGKILTLYKSYRNKYEGWVLPKGTVEQGEEPQDTAVREVLEESGASVKIVKYIGDTQYTFNTVSDTIKKTVHWYLDNQEWLDNVASGDYQKYYEKMYAE